MSKERDGRELGRVDQLPRAVYHWGTPRVAKNGGCRNKQATGKESRIEDQVHAGHPAPEKSNTNGKSQGWFVTPKASDSKSPGKSRDVHLNHQTGGPSSKLNPNWVEHLMGLEIGWTALDYSEME